jgi:hypothetical protein
LRCQHAVPAVHGRGQQPRLRAPALPDRREAVLRLQRRRVLLAVPAAVQHFGVGGPCAHVPAPQRLITPAVAVEREEIDLDEVEFLFALELR